jgi:dehydrogenase/reductase SDR family protein 7B
MNFKDKVVWITGATSGIGEALAFEFASKGARLVLSARRQEQLEAVATLAHDRGAPEVMVQTLDLADAATLQPASDAVLARMGRVDALFNNGGISQRDKALNTPLEVDRRVMEIDFFGTVALTKAVLPSMLEHGGGHIAVTSSLVGKFGSPYRSAYAAAKHALHGFYDSLRAELHDQGLKVTIFCPGFIRTQISVNAVTGSGEKLGTMDDAQANGMSPEKCAAIMVRSMEQGRNEVYIGGREKLGIYVKRFFPNIFARIIRKAKVR